VVSADMPTIIELSSDDEATVQVSKKVLIKAAKEMHDRNEGGSTEAVAVPPTNNSALKSSKTQDMSNQFTTDIKDLSIKEGEDVLDEKGAEEDCSSIHIHS
jgi:hypothetical protein